jgi:hypothetical protein
MNDDVIVTHTIEYIFNIFQQIALLCLMASIVDFDILNVSLLGVSMI